MTKEDEEKMKQLVAMHIADKATELAEKSGNKWVSYFFRLLATVGLLISGGLAISQQAPDINGVPSNHDQPALVCNA